MNVVISLMDLVSQYETETWPNWPLNLQQRMYLQRDPLQKGKTLKERQQRERKNEL